MTKFKASDLKGILGVARGKSLFIALRREDLGTEITARSRNGNKHYKNLEAIRVIIVFDVEECIKCFEDKLHAEEINPFKNKSPYTLRCWENTIDNLKLVKEANE